MSTLPNKEEWRRVTKLAYEAGFAVFKNRITNNRQDDSSTIVYEFRAITDDALAGVKKDIDSMAANHRGGTSLIAMAHFNIKAMAIRIKDKMPPLSAETKNYFSVLTDCAIDAGLAEIARQGY